jgi:hypothetical protein
MIKCAATIVMVLAGLVSGLGQNTNAVTTTATTNHEPVVEPEKEGWSLGLSVTANFIPDGREYVQPTITADRGVLHLEARYNYEALETGSVWVGYNFSGGDKLSWELTPMLGGVFGNTTGFAPGYEGTLSWWKLELYSEGEVVFDAGDTDDSFFYNWSELSLWPVESFRFGLVTQRTRAYQNNRDVQRGLLLGVSLHRVDLTAYLMNPDDDNPTFMLTGGLNF